MLSAAAPGWKRPVGQAGDDRFVTATLPLWHGEAFLAVCADGAGSAQHGGRGAEVACKTSMKLLKRMLTRRALRRGLPDAAELRALNLAVYQALKREAARLGTPLRELSTTLLVLAATPLGTACSQIGDGVMVVRIDGAFEHVFWPDQGEFANTTYFATEHPQRVLIAHLPPVQAVAAMTDGLQTLALDYAAHRPHAPFFTGLFAELARGVPAALQPPLLALLTSPGVRARTDDDVTLLLALPMSEASHAAA